MKKIEIKKIDLSSIENSALGFSVIIMTLFVIGIIIAVPNNILQNPRIGMAFFLGTLIVFSLSHVLARAAFFAREIAGKINLFIHNTNENQ
jgi:uncharacterized membrane protein